MKKVSVGVGGRFHSDFMFESLTHLGYSTGLVTSLPQSRFRVPQKAIQSCVWPEVIFRVSRKLGFESWGDSVKIKFFGRFLSKKLIQARPDVFIGWSSFSLETLRERPAKAHVLMRDSSHIKFQYDLLTEEYEKFGFKFPNRKFCLDRELEEYELADRIWVLSDFAKSTFIKSGIHAEKIGVVPLGVDLEKFRPLEKMPEPSPLRVIYFGTINFRKGVHYLLEATKDFSPRELELSLIGVVEPEFKSTMAKYSHFNYSPAMLQSELAHQIRGHHVFVFPTLEDGFGQTLIQAMASGLVPITTDHCGAADFTFLKDSQWRISSRSSEEIKNCLLSLMSSREMLVDLRMRSIEAAQKMTWVEYRKRIDYLLSSLPVSDFISV